MAAAAIIVHSLDQALLAVEAAAALSVPLVLRSAAGAGGAAGVGWFAALRDAVAERHPGQDIIFVLDCAEESATVLAALRSGLTHFRWHGPPEVGEKLAAICRAAGAALEFDDGPALDLLDEANAAEACRTWLAGCAPGCPMDRAETA